ncbi:MAG TPA: response regulator [Polyangiaceae bacterium]
MGRSLRALLIDDSEEDAQVVLSALRRGGFDMQWRRVETAEGMLSALQSASWDVVLSDYSMQRFNALDALAILKEAHLDLPFIIVSATVGEEPAVEAMRLGAHDYLLKDNLARLAPAVDREVREAAVRAERNSMQEQLMMADRMVSVGTLAAAVAHEINNPLATLMANLEFLAQDISEFVTDAGGRSTTGQRPAADWLAWISARSARIAQPLGHAREAAERVRLIARDLKVFSHPDDDRRGPVDLVRVLESSVRMSWNEVRHRAHLNREYETISPVYGNEARLGQVFLNLIVNAAQAIPEGNADHNQITISTKILDSGDTVVEIRDTGTGIAPEVLPRIFEPFFTTKPVGVGTGLGLAICRRIITMFGGEISVDSQLSRGTTVRVVLPSAPPEVIEEQAPNAGLSAPPARMGKILVIDDEPLLGDVLRRLFAAEHHVVADTEARVALRRMTDGERFDVVFCDLIMPVMTGYELHAELRRLAPTEADKIVFMTGGAFTPAAREFLASVPNARIEKPFDLTKVRALVRSLLR